MEVDFNDDAPQIVAFEIIFAAVDLAAGGRLVRSILAILSSGTSSLRCTDRELGTDIRLHPIRHRSRGFRRICRIRGRTVIHFRISAAGRNRTLLSKQSLSVRPSQTQD